MVKFLPFHPDAETTIENVSGFINLKEKGEKFLLKLLRWKICPITSSCNFGNIGRITEQLESGTITPSASSLLPALQSDYEKIHNLHWISKETIFKNNIIFLTMFIGVKNL